MSCRFWAFLGAFISSRTKPEILTSVSPGNSPFWWWDWSPHTPNLSILAAVLWLGCLSSSTEFFCHHLLWKALENQKFHSPVYHTHFLFHKTFSLLNDPTSSQKPMVIFHFRSLRGKSDLKPCKHLLTLYIVYYRLVLANFALLCLADFNFGWQCWIQLVLGNLKQCPGFGVHEPSVIETFLEIWIRPLKTIPWKSAS